VCPPECTVLIERNMSLFYVGTSEWSGYRTQEGNSTGNSYEHLMSLSTCSKDQSQSQMLGAPCLPNPLRSFRASHRDGQYHRSGQTQAEKSVNTHLIRSRTCNCDTYSTHQLLSKHQRGLEAKPSVAGVKQVTQRRTHQLKHCHLELTIKSIPIY
jgi:hypothetical protein